MKPVIKFIHEARTELAKVNWPTQAAAIRLTLTVVGISIAFVLFITVVDYGLTEGFKYLATVAKNTQSEGRVIQAPSQTIDVEDLQNLINAQPAGE